MFVLGLALFVLWGIGLAYGTLDWLLWLDFTVALVSLFGALSLVDSRGPVARVAWPGALSLVAVILWIFGVAADMPRWESWWTLVIAMAYLAVAVVIGTRQAREARSATG
jgi:hypothetical protein